MAFVSKAVSETLYWGVEAFRRIVFGEIGNSAVMCIVKRHTFVALLRCFWRAGEVYGWCSTVMGLICTALKIILRVDCKVARKRSIYNWCSFFSMPDWSDQPRSIFAQIKSTYLVYFCDWCWNFWTYLTRPWSGTEIRHVYGKWKCVNMLKWLSKGFYIAT